MNVTWTFDRQSLEKHDGEVRVDWTHQLRPWLNHDEDCGYNTAQPGTSISDRKKACTCGLSQILGATP